jgi:hypothetical protein
LSTVRAYCSAVANALQTVAAKRELALASQQVLLAEDLAAQLAAATAAAVSATRVMLLPLRHGPGDAAGVVTLHVVVRALQ